MATKGDRIIIGITAAMGPVLQPGSRFTDRTYGLDDGSRKYLAHPGCPASRWPKKGARDPDNPGMYVLDVTADDDPSGLIQIDVSLKGIAGTKPNRVTPDCDVQMFTIPVIAAAGGSSANVLLPVPQPSGTNEYVSTIKPTLTGVGVPLAASWLPALPNWSAAYLPDASKPPTYNYYADQWVLQTRTWQEIVPGKVWFVREKAVYYYRIASA